MNFSSIGEPSDEASISLFEVSSESEEASDADRSSELDSSEDEVDSESASDSELLSELINEESSDISHY
jgi:hypothetical protein